MEIRPLGRTGLGASALGVGMWGVAGWTGTEQTEAESALDLAVESGCTFFDTAWGYGDGASEQVLGALIARHPGRRLIAATKVPPKNLLWPSRRGYRLDAVFPPAHIREYALRSRENLGIETIDLLQFHVWEDAWAVDPSWQDAITTLREERVIGHAGVSVNRWEPWNVLRTLETGLIGAVQVIYNIFDQAPEDELFPACRELGVGVIARVPFDEGSLTGTLTVDSRWPEGDWRNTYFVPENLGPTVERIERLRLDVPNGMTMPELALRFSLGNPDVSTVIPGMRQRRHVGANVAAAAAGRLPDDVVARLRAHRWDREPTEWSQ
jgi:aryl-alcohol dehydrogenase-like predicted oxidoreductase